MTNTMDEWKELESRIREVADRLDSERPNPTGGDAASQLLDKVIAAGRAVPPTCNELPSDAEFRAEVLALTEEVQDRRLTPEERDKYADPRRELLFAGIALAQALREFAAGMTSAPRKLDPRSGPTNVANHLEEARKRIDEYIKRNNQPDVS